MCVNSPLCLSSWQSTAGTKYTWHGMACSLQTYNSTHTQSRGKTATIHILPFCKRSQSKVAKCHARPNQQPPIQFTRFCLNKNNISEGKQWSCWRANIYYVVSELNSAAQRFTVDAREVHYLWYNGHEFTMIHWGALFIPRQVRT